MEPSTPKSGRKREEEGKKEQGPGVISVTASPFVPVHSPQSSACPDLSNSKHVLSPLAPVFRPRNFLQYNQPPVIHEQQEDLEKSRDSEEEALDELRTAIHLLTIDPGHFEVTMPALAQKLVACLENRTWTLKAIIEEIFGQCIYETNFRYTGARMCNYLCLSPEMAFRNFQQELLARCEREYQIIISSPKLSLPRMIGYAIFAGELLLNIKDIHLSEANIQLPDQINRLLILLLDDRSKEALLCCVQVLKLTGAVLEENLPNLDEIFARIEALIKVDGISQNVIGGMQSVITQRMNSWGQRSSDPSMSSGAGDSNDYPMDEAAMTDNEIYNNHSFASDERDMASLIEEDQFLNDQYFIGDEKMDDETASAFEQFMAESHSSSIPLFRSREDGPGTSQ